MSRRDVLLAALATGCAACEAGPVPAPSSAPSRPPASSPRATRSSAVRGPAGAAGNDGELALEVITTGRMADAERGGSLVVLLHGWGAPGDDLVSLARALERPHARFVLPAGPLGEGAGGRAWWHRGARGPARASGDALPEGHEPSPWLRTVREALRALITGLARRHEPDSIALVGFSQGAMLALDVALAMAPTIDRVAALSGALLVDSLPALKAPGAARPAALVAHGTRDAIVPFSFGELARDLLVRHGVDVRFHAFDGGHGIPRDVVDALARFTFEPRAGAAGP